MKVRGRLPLLPHAMPHNVCSSSRALQSRSLITPDSTMCLGS